jgi:polysaccharide chain length determinant protein (PEP-CTERM system associated)
MTDRVSAQRRPFDFEDYIDVLRRNVRWLIGPAFLGLVLATVVAYLIEDTYVSRALIRIVPQQVPENLVQTAVNQQIADRLNAMAETIKSRNSLQSIITTYGLYKKQINDAPLDDVIDLMRRKIKIQPTEGLTNVNGRSLPAFQVSFSYDNRYLAQKVCAELVGRFLTENAKTRVESAVATNQFLNDEYEKARAELEGIENKLTQFRIRNAGHLPEEMQMNMSQMNSLDTRLTGLNDSLTRAMQQKMMLESQLQIAKDRLASIHEAGSESAVRDARLDQLDRDITAATNNLNLLKDRYTESYPDLVNARAQLAQLKQQRDQLLHEPKPAKTESKPSSAARSRERMDAEAVIQQLNTHIRATDVQIADLNKQIAGVNQSIKQYQSRVESVPVGEKEYNDLIRDRDLAKQRYQDLQMKRSSSAISMEMENRKQGESLEILDQASLPDTPTAPKRRLIIPLGVLAGLFLGLVITAIREVKDNSLKNLKDARVYSQLPILGSVPLLENDLVVQRRRQMMWIGWAGATIVGLAIMAGSIAHYYMSKV